MRLNNVIDILYEEREQVRKEIKKAKREAKKECWLTKRVNQLIRGKTGEDDIWYLERLNRELSEAIKVLEEHGRSEG